MLERIDDIDNVGRFVGCPGSAALRRLTLIVGANGSGKSTLTRALAAAAARGDDLLLDHTLAAAGPPRLSLVVDGAPCRYAHGTWSGPTPRIAIFNREFVEANVYVGRATAKEQRRGLLRLALGASDVDAARTIDALTVRGRELVQARRPHQAILSMASATTAALADLERQPRPVALPAFPKPELARWQQILESGAVPDRGGEPGADPTPRARVAAHLETALNGDEAWLRAGLAHLRSADCPFCAQPMTDEANALVAAYRSWFDGADDRILDELAAMRAEVAELTAWWHEVRAIGRANLVALSAWNAPDVSDASEPSDRPPRLSFDSERRHGEVLSLVAQLTALIDAKARRPRHPLGREPARPSHTPSAVAVLLTPIRQLIEEVDAATRVYNRNVGHALAWLEGRRTRPQAGTPALTPAMRIARAELVRLDEAIAANDGAKAQAAEALRQTSARRLSNFAAQVDATLAMLGARFRIAQLGAERAGGTSGARFTVRVPHGEMRVADERSGARLARLLSDGDRSALALAVFLGSLSGEPELLAQTTVVLDDPAAGHDAHRRAATARRLAQLAISAGQVIVLSHDAVLLAEIADAWRAMHGSPDQLSELMLHPITGALCPRG